jgi:mitogen-activated protein kinase kinase kinase
MVGASTQTLASETDQVRKTFFYLVFVFTMLTGQPFTEAELLAICLSPDHPLRENGLVLRRLPRTTTGNAPFNQSNRNTKRASSISILSDLGVRNPERALDAPELPLPSHSSLAPSGRLSPASYISNARRPSKLRNFFGQRPPSELITNHLTEFFPNAQKKVLQRTARNSMMRRRESVVSYKQPSSRFSTSTQGSRISQPPPVPDKGDTEDLPRVSLSTDDGRSVDLHIDSVDVRKDSVPHLPPIPFPSAPLSEFIDDATSNIQKKRMSRTMSTSSKRLSLITELRSKRDKSDTASLMTVDQITEAVESRRASTVFGREEDLDGWTKVDSEIESMVPTAVADDDGAVDEDDDDDDDDDDSEMSDDEEDETLNDDAAELGLDLDDDGLIRNVMNAKRGKPFLKRILGILLINLPLQLINGSRELLSVQGHLEKCISGWMLLVVSSWQ